VSRFADAGCVEELVRRLIGAVVLCELEDIEPIRFDAVARLTEIMAQRYDDLHRPKKNCFRCGRTQQLRRGLCHSCYEIRRQRDKAYGRWQTQYVEAGPVREHVRLLVAAGIGTRRLETLSGVSRSALQNLLNGRKERGTGPSAKVAESTAERILAIPIPTESHRLAGDHALVLSVGSTRRLQALVAMGYTQSYLAGRLGVTAANSTELFHGKRLCVTASRAREIEALYTELSVAPPETASARRSRCRAQKLGWVDPFGWGDDDIDNLESAPEPLGPTVPMSFEERYAELRDLGYTGHEIARRFEVDEKSLTRRLQRYGIDPGDLAEDSA
jgi:transcriptional regulator with XRE-family HTH domain